jgi:hypothetical protein
MTLISARRQRHSSRVVMRLPSAFVNESGRCGMDGSALNAGRGGFVQSAPVFSLAVSLGPKARLISAWGIAPGIVTPPNLSQAPTARFIAFDKYLSGAALSSSRDLVRAFSPHFLFFDSLPGALPQADFRKRLWR